jgi:hypothetical protein
VISTDHIGNSLLPVCGLVQGLGREKVAGKDIQEIYFYKKGSKLRENVSMQKNRQSINRID